MADKLSTANVNPGYFFSYTSGINRQYDYTCRFGSVALKYLSKTETNKTDRLLHQLDISGVRRFSLYNYKLIPYVSGGIGAGYYDGHIFPSFPVCAGGRIRIVKDVYVNAEIQYRFNTGDAPGNYFQGNFGLLGTIIKRKYKEKKQVPLQLTPVAAHDERIAMKRDRVHSDIIDSDGDGIPDKEDACPNVPGFAENKGCPYPAKKDTGYTNAVQRIQLKEKLDAIAAQIYFKVNSADLSASSRQKLNELVIILNEHNSGKLFIEGHTDSTGSSPQNLLLSRQRAAAVLQYLHQQGIAVSKMQSNGYGATVPKTTNETAEGRAINRRTELKWQE
ncbi:OmpA family protein [Chitinophaga niastensis]|nr:OmpA family protein [Chitinophaga niastensis]